MGYWTVSKVTSLIIGNHEILQENNRWGSVDILSTITGQSQCSLIDTLQRNCQIDCLKKINNWTETTIDNIQ